MFAVREEMIGKRYARSAQCVGKAQGIFGGDGLVGERVPEERGRKIVRYVAFDAYVVAGKAVGRAEYEAD